MHLPSWPFETEDWTGLPVVEQPGLTGFARRRVRMMNDIRVRLVEYSPGYSADHWCEKGHILHCLEGQMETALEDGRVFILRAGMTYFVGDHNEPHRSNTTEGCKLFVVD